ncbi:hypothetical protein BJY01DRAFT_213151 [Aspergillus pseudoustus]|uniref:DUF7580 domain-containing protein n=1 Tax=Aspergillus pseudoustus TaxID=1810923 RepID=A0ABR4K4D7_9EURO
MCDPLSAAGLAIGVLDILITLGERLGDLISTAQAFEDDTATFYNLINDENIQTKLLSNLMFSECSVYGGKTLFEQFDQDIQKQIVLFAGEIESILQEGISLLERRYGMSPDPKLPDARGRSSPSLPNLFKWTFRDRKRVAAILRSFEDRNARVKSKVEFWCFVSQLGASVDHLKHLQTNESSRRLGFDRDASLRLTQCSLPGSGHAAETLELVDLSWDLYLRDIQPIKHQGALTAFTKDGAAYVQENHKYIGQDSMVDARTKHKIESLARLLHQPKEQLFRILPCVGWKFLPAHSCITFVFEIPSRPLGIPVSLQSRLFNRSERPELGDRFRLALGLAKCIAQLHMVQWLHESFRSDNILLFPHWTDEEPNRRLDVNYRQPWVFGFEYSRPEPFFSAGTSDFEPSRDIYCHPDRQGQPTQMFQKIHDIYALGVVLLEIGIWEPALKFEKDMFARVQNPRAVQAQLVKHARKRLEAKVGRRYMEIVLRCLTGGFGVEEDTKEDLRLQQAFRHTVIDVLEMAASSI